MKKSNIHTNMKNIDEHIRWNIKDFVKKNPTEVYKQIVLELTRYFRQRCGKKCKIARDKFHLYMNRPVLCRISNSSPCKCGRHVSLPEHKLCYECAEKGTEEFEYHHRLCERYETTIHLTTPPFTSGYE